MKEFISKETAKAFSCHECERPGCPEIWGGVCHITDRLNAIPAADAVEVVRCKDCINWNGNDCVTMYGLFAPRPDDYCSRGERMMFNGN